MAGRPATGNGSAARRRALAGPRGAARSRGASPKSVSDRFCPTLEASGVNYFFRFHKGHDRKMSMTAEAKVMVFP